MNIQFSTTGRRNQPMGLGGKLFVSVICLIFFTAGVFVAYLMGRQIIESLATRGWQTTACTIVRRSIAETPPYTARLDYTYPFCGNTYKGNVISTGYRGSDDYYDAQKILNAFPAGPGSVCRVNPADPAAAVLQTPSLWILFEILFPLVFIAVGGGLFYLIWWPPKLTAHPSDPTKSRKVTMILCGGFFVTGVAMLCIAASMYQRYRSVQNWVAVPCTIVRSSVAGHTSSSDHGDSTTYSVEVLFRYTFDKKHHASSRYSLTSSSSSGYADKKKIADQLNHNRRQTCYVNPLDPDDAVLDRHDEFLVVILAVMGSIFFAVGAGALGATARSVRKQQRSGLQENVPPAQRGPVTLHPQVPRWSELLAILLMALFWNGVVSVFVVTAVQGWLDRRHDVVLTLFLVPFVLTGLGLFIGVIVKSRSLFLPAAHLWLSRSPLEIGERAELRWQIAGDANKIRRLQIRSVVFEISPDPSGSLALKNLDPVWSADLVDANRQADIQSGHRALTISEPITAKEAFKRIWAIQVDCDLGKSKPLREVFPIHVLATALVRNPAPSAGC